MSLNFKKIALIMLILASSGSEAGWLVSSGNKISSNRTASVAVAGAAAVAGLGYLLFNKYGRKTVPAVKRVASNMGTLKSLLVMAELGSSSPEGRNRLFQELKDDKLRATLCARDGSGAKFWLDHGASLSRLTAEHCKGGRKALGGAWTEVDANGKMVLFIDSGRYADAGIMLYPGEDSDQDLKDLLKNYGVSDIKFWYDFPLVRDPEEYLSQIQSGERTGLER